MSFNVIWWRRWRRHETAPPRRRRCGRMRVHARFVTGVVPHRPRRRKGLLRRSPEEEEPKEVIDTEAPPDEMVVSKVVGNAY